MALMWNRTVDWDAEDWRRSAACRNTEPDLFFPVGTTGPAFDQITTMSKLLSLGMALAAVIRASTSAPAMAVGRKDLGHLGIGAVGDASVIELAEGEFDYRDVLGETRKGRQRLGASGLVIAGKWWDPA